MQAARARRLIALLALATVACVRGVVAQGGPTSATLSTPVRRSIPAQPDSRHVFVFDSAHLLTEPEIAALQDSVQQLQSATGADIAFVTLPTLHGGSVEEAALAIGRAWKVGSAGAAGDPTRNRGLVMLYVPDKKSVAGANLRVEVGRGLEGAITDAGGSRAVIEAIKPPFRAKHYGDGFIAGFNVAARLIVAENSAQPIVRQAPPPPTVSATSGVPWAAIVFETLALFAVIVMIIVWRRRRGSPVLDLTPRTEPPASNSSAWFALSQLGKQSSSSASDDDNNRSSGSSSPDTSSSSDGGSFGGGGGFSGGGSSDSV